MLKARVLQDLQGFWSVEVELEFSGMVASVLPLIADNEDQAKEQGRELAVALGRFYEVPIRLVSEDVVLIPA